MTFDWKNRIRFTLGSKDPDLLKFETIKYMIVLRTIKEYLTKSHMVSVYTNFELEEGLKPEVFVEHLKEKRAIAYEIRSKWTNQTRGKKDKDYKNFDHPFFKITWIPIDIRDFGDDINEIFKQLRGQII